MSETAIADVGQSLVDLLKAGAEDGSEEAKVALTSPAVARMSDLRLTLLLYKVAENAFLKNPDRRMVPPSNGDGVPILVRTPLTLDLHYMLTAYPPAGDNPTVQEVEAHKHLSRAMRVLYENGILAGSQLRGGLQGSDVKLRVTMNPITMEDITRIWSVYPDVPYRTSVAYLVSPVPIVSRLSETAHPVVQRDGRYGERLPPPAELNA